MPLHRALATRSPRAALGTGHSATFATARARIGRDDRRQVALATHPGVLREVAARACLACVKRSQRQDDDHPAVGRRPSPRRRSPPLRWAPTWAPVSCTPLARPPVCRLRCARSGARSGCQGRSGSTSARRVLLTSRATSSTAPYETRRNRRPLAALGGELKGWHAVANADIRCPYAAFGSTPRSGSRRQNWTADAMVSLLREADRARQGLGWRCGSCELHRRIRTSKCSSGAVSWRGTRMEVALKLPGRVNVGNAAHALPPPSCSAFRRRRRSAMASCAGRTSRYSETCRTRSTWQVAARQEPGGWVEMLELLESEPTRPVIVDFNSATPTAAIRPGLGCPSERLRGRQVMVTVSGVRTSGSGWPTPESRTKLYPAPRPLLLIAPEGVVDVVRQLHRVS